MLFTGSTRVVGLFGDPVAHSLSPLMQNAALQAAAIDAVYVPFHVTPGDLGKAIDGIRRLGLTGVNLTLPHKEAALAFIDELDKEARSYGAVNTIVNQDGRLIGYNTDGPGLLRVLRSELKFDVAGCRVLLLGAGGACRAAAAALIAADVAWLGVANRTGEKASELVARLGSLAQGTTLADFTLDSALSGKLPDQVDLLINTTSLGLNGEVWPYPVLDWVQSDGAVYDAVYGRQSTSLCLAAQAAGLRSADGLGMLAAQGELAFRLWFGQNPPAGVMQAALQEVRSC